MQFDNVVDYIWQTYHVGIPVEHAEKHAKPLTYLKLVRVLSVLNIDPTDMDSTALFAEAARLERHGGGRPAHHAEWLFKLADLHEECEMLIRGSGVLDAGDSYADNINS